MIQTEQDLVKARVNLWLIGAGFYLLALFCYAPAMRGGFIWDDDYYVTGNTALREGLAGLQRLWIGIYPSPQQYPVPQYYPMTHTSFWMQTIGHDWREPLNPTPFHVVNVLLHATAAMLLWIILRKLSVPGALLAAGLFLLHPVQVESVAWITERKNVLSGAFMMLSLLVYLRYCGLDPAPSTEREVKFGLPPEPWKVYALSLLLFVCAILSKSVTGVLPAVILVILWWKHGRISLQNVLPLLPFFALAAAMGAWTGWMERNVVGAQGPDWELGLLNRIIIAGTAVWFYLYKLIAPLNLAFMYERWELRPWMLIFPIAALGVLAALVALHRRIGRGPAAIALLFVGTLFPALGFVNFLPQVYSFVADHFQYHASAAVFVAIAALIHQKLKPEAARAAYVLLLPLSILTMTQSRIYRDVETLWRDTIAKTPTSWMAHNNLGALLLRRGELAEAYDHLAESVRLRPNNVMAIMNIGQAYEVGGKDDKAEQTYRAAIAVGLERERLAGRGYRELALPYYNLGLLLQRSGRADEAIEAYRRAIEYNPAVRRDSAYALGNLSELLRQKGDLQAALELASRAVALDPRSVSNLMCLGNALADAGQFQQAMDQFVLANEIEPDNYMILHNVGRVHAGAGNFDAAIRWFEGALKLKPDFETARLNLERAREMKARAATQPSTTPGTQPSEN